MRKGLLITMVMSLLLTGCSAAGQSDTNIEDAAKKETTIMFTSDKEIINPSEEGMWWHNAQAIGDTVYYMTSESEDRETAAGIYKKSAGAEQVRVVKMEDIFVDEFAVDEEGNIYVLSYDRSVYHVRKYDENGEILFERKAEGSGRYLMGSGKLLGGGVPAASEEGFCILSNRGVCLIWDARCEAVAQVEVDWYEQGMQTAYGDFGIVKGAEDIYVYHREDRSVFLQAVDFETGTLKEAVEIKMPQAEKPVWPLAHELYSAYEDGIYIADYEAMYLYDDKTGELAELFQWGEPGINLTQNNIMAIGKDEDGRLLFYEYNFLTKESAKICVGEEEITRHLLTLGYVDDGFVVMEGEYITEFNRMQDDILISYKEYADIEALQQDLAAGTGPDILELSGIDIEEYAEKGILEGLDSYLEKSDSLNKDDILPSMLEAMTVNDEVRFLAPSFMIWTMLLGNEEAAEDGLTVMEFLGLETGEDGYLCDWREESLFSTFLGRDMDQYVDWEKRECSFDDGRFAAFLEAVKAANLPGEERDTSGYLYKDMEQGKYLAAFRGADTLQSVKEMRKAMGEVAMITGWPDSEGNLEYDISFSYGMLGINSASAKKDIAWEYLEYHLQAYAESCQRYSASLSVLTDTFEEQLYPKAENNFSYISKNPFTGGMEQIRFNYSEEDRELLRSMVENVKMSRTARYMGMIGSIIDEEADAFFSGEKSAEEVAGIIQERVSAYMKE